MFAHDSRPLKVTLFPINFSPVQFDMTEFTIPITRTWTTDSPGYAAILSRNKCYQVREKLLIACN